MRAQRRDGHDEESVRPVAARLDSRSDAALFEAAAAKRPEVLGPQGMLRMQRAVGNAGTAAVAEEGSFEGVPSGGSPLSEDVRGDMESRLGADFSDVRVHTGGDAHSSAKSVDAEAYTVGSDIVFQQGKFDPDSSSGQTMLAHELTHVVQQRSGPVDGTPSGGVNISDPSDRFERDAVANADKVMSEPAPAAATPAAASSPGPSVQRTEDAEELQTFVQRAAEHDHGDEEVHDEDS